MIEYLALLDIYKNICIKDFMALSRINKHLYDNYSKDEVIWEYYCREKFTDVFCNRAQLQQKFNWKLCLSNILDFEHKLNKTKFSLWSEQEYFEWWNVKGW